MTDVNPNIPIVILNMTEIDTQKMFDRFDFKKQDLMICWGKDIFCVKIYEQVESKKFKKMSSSNSWFDCPYKHQIKDFWIRNVSRKSERIFLKKWWEYKEENIYMYTNIDTHLYIFSLLPIHFSICSAFMPSFGFKLFYIFSSLRTSFNISFKGIADRKLFAFCFSSACGSIFEFIVSFSFSNSDIVLRLFSEFFHLAIG